MSGASINYDHDDLISALRVFETESRERAELHAGDTPSVPPGAAGRDFTSVAARLNSAFRRVHELGQHRIDARVAYAVAGIDQVERFTRTDGNVASAWKAGQ